MIQDKTQFAENGCSLHQDCNAVLDHLGSSLWASRETVVRGVTSLGKETTITCETCLAANDFPTR